jgi:hypothetical protein
MFPNKLRAENYGNSRQFEFYGERKIVSLMKEKVIQEFKDFKEGVDNYKKVKSDIKKALKSNAKERKREAKHSLKKTKYSSLL